MNPSYHLFFGLVFSSFLLILFPEIGLANLSLVFLSSVLIDIGHYLFYIYEKRGGNLRKAYDYFMKHKKLWKEFGKSANYVSPPFFCIFHGLEIIILLFVFSFFFKPAYFIFVGFSFHIFLDWIEQTIYSRKYKKISLVNDFLNYKCHK